jgi:nitrogenase molybdenum-cofactor synthesis protein NifE
MTYAHRAKLNVMICSKALINLAHKMEERYGIPYIEESFYGVEDMNNCLRHIAQTAGGCRLAGSGRSADCRRNRQVKTAACPLSGTADRVSAW